MPDDASLGIEALKRGDHAVAAGHLERAHQAKPDDVGLMVALGIASAELGRLDQGISLLGQAVQHQPDSITARYNLGLALERAGHTSDALREQRAVLTIAPAHEKAGAAVRRLQGAVGRSSPGHEGFLRSGPGLPASASPAGRLGFTRPVLVSILLAFVVVAAYIGISVFEAGYRVWNATRSTQPASPPPEAVAPHPVAPAPVPPPIDPAPAPAQSPFQGAWKAVAADVDPNLPESEKMAAALAQAAAKDGALAVMADGTFVAIILIPLRGTWISDGRTCTLTVNRWAGMTAQEYDQFWQERGGVPHRNEEAIQLRLSSDGQRLHQVYADGRLEERYWYVRDAD